MSDSVAGRLETLDALRGVGTLLVIIYHLNFLPGGLLSNCYVGLDLFFVLSGFVISMTYDQRLAAGYPFVRFMEARIIRLYPMYAVGLLLGAAMVVGWMITGSEHALSMRVAAEGLFFGAFILPAPSAPEDFFPLNGPFWSLLFEVIGYILYSLFAPRLSRVALALIALAAGGALVFYGPMVGSLEVGSTWATAPGGLFRVLFSFTIGVLLLRMLPAGLQRRTWWALAPVVAMVVVLAWPVPRQFVVVYDLAIILLFCPLLIGIGACLRPPAILTRACQSLGEISYPMYVIHFPLIFATGFVAKLLGIPTPVWSVAFVVGVAVAALLASRLYDQPMRAWLTAKARERRAPKPVAAQQQSST